MTASSCDLTRPWSDGLDAAAGSGQEPLVSVAVLLTVKPYPGRTREAELRACLDDRSGLEYLERPSVIAEVGQEGADDRFVVAYGCAGGRMAG